MLTRKRSRSLQNFYCCRYEVADVRAHVPVLYKISTVVDAARRSAAAHVPVLYKISTVVDSASSSRLRTVPVLYKISTVVD